MMRRFRRSRRQAMSRRSPLGPAVPGMKMVSDVDRIEPRFFSAIAYSEACCSADLFGAGLSSLL